MPFDVEAFERHFSRGAPQNLKCRLLQEGNGRWESFVSDLRRLMEEGSNLGIDEAVKFVQRNYKPLPAEFLPPPPPPPVKKVSPDELPAGSVPWRKVICWVFENIGKLPDENTAPTKGAMELLLWVNAGPANMKEFYCNIWPRILPTKAMVEEQYGKEEETDELLIGDINGILRDIDAEIDAEERMGAFGPEGLPPELALASEDSG